MNRNGILKNVATALGGVYLWANCLFAYAPESSFWTDRRKQAERDRATRESMVASLPGSMTAVSGPKILREIPVIGPFVLGMQISDTVQKGLPPDFLKNNSRLFSILSRAPGTVRRISLPKWHARVCPIVVHIQDVHQNEEAQRNIGAAIEDLLVEGKANLLALEGALGDIPLQPFRDFQNPKAVRQAADFLLKENKISGPIHAVLSGTGPLCPVIGIDDPVHYNANVEAYRQAIPLQSKIQKTLRGRSRTLEHEKTKGFSSALLKFDAQAAAYGARQLSLGDFVQVMLSQQKEESLSLSLRQYFKAVAMERDMDFQQVERERNALIEQLSRKISPAQENDLLTVTLAYRAGKVRPAHFYDHLNRLCGQNGISLTKFSAMDTYLHYVLLADKINPESLYRDILSLEQETYRRLARTQDERRLVAQSKTLALTEKLVEFSLTPGEWDEYETGGSGETVVEEHLKPFKSFYREAKKRDQLMADHLLRAMGEMSGQVAVLVTGGFHAEGLTENLTRAGVTVVSFVPKIEKLDTAQGSAYLSVFTQEKTPLEKLFQGEKLFLADHPVSPGILHTLLPLLAVTGALYLGGLSMNLDPRVLYSDLGGVGILGAVKIRGDHVRLRLSGRNQEAFLLIEMTSSKIMKVVETGREMLSVARGLREGWVQTKEFLKNEYTIEDRINPFQIRKEVVDVLPVLLTLLYNALISPVSPWVFLVSGSVSLGWFLWGHQKVFRVLQESTPDPYKKFVPWVYFSFVSLGFVIFTGFGVGAFKAVVSLAPAESGGALAAVLVGAVMAFYKGVTLSHGFTNVRLALPATKQKSKIPVNGATLQKWYQKFRKAYLPLILPIKEKLTEGDRFSLLLREIKQALDLNDTLGSLFSPEEAVDDIIHFVEALQTYLLLANNLAIGDLTLFDRLLLVDRDHSFRVSYMGQPITIYPVINVGTKTEFHAVLPTNSGSLVGMVFVDHNAAAEEAKSKKFVKQDRRDIEYAVLDWNTRIALARVKHFISVSLRDNLKTYESHGDPVLKLVLKPDRSLIRALPPEVNLMPEEGDDPNVEAYTERVKAEMALQIFVQLFEGTIEHFYHLRSYCQNDEKSHALASLAVNRIWMSAKTNGNDSMRRGHEKILELLNLSLSDDQAVWAAFNSPHGHLNTMDKLISAMNEFYTDQFILPEDRFFQIHSRNPSTEELDELYGRKAVVQHRSQVNATRNKTSAPSLERKSPLLEKLLARGKRVSLPPVYLNQRNKSFIEKASTLWDTYSNGSETMEGFTQLLSEMEGKQMGHGGLRGESQRINGDPAVREIGALLEDLLTDTAQNVFEKKLIRAQANFAREDFKSAIGELLEMRGNEDFLDSLGIEKALELDEHLATLRGRLSVQGSATSSHFSPRENPELFGLDPQEVALLTELSQAKTDVSRMGFCREAVALLKKKLGRFAPAGLEKVESQSDPRDLSINDDVVRLLGFRIFLSESLQKGQGYKLWLDHSREILKKITESLKRCDVDQIERKRDQINPMASGRSLKGNLRGVQREYIQDHSLRIYFRIFNDGNIALIEVDNKGSSTTKGAMNPELSNRLLPYAGASSFYNPLYEGFRPVLSRGKDSLVAGGEKPKGLPASIADRLARNQWREDGRKYYVYTKYMAPAWEWMYFVPGLNLVGQWGLSDWIIKKIFPSAQGHIVLQVAGQSRVTGMGVFALGLGFWVGGAGLLVGVFFCALTLSYVFSEAHLDTGTSEWISLFKRGGVLALVLMAPILLLYWWDPIWLTGMGAVLGYLGAFVTGMGSNYFLHSYLQPVEKIPNRLRKEKSAESQGANTKPHGQDADATKDSEVDGFSVEGDFERYVLRLAMEAERCLALGDVGQAKKYHQEISSHLKGMNAPLRMSYVNGLNDRILAMDGIPQSGEGRVVSELLGLMEESFVSWDFRPLFGARDMINEKKYFVTPQQKGLIEIWDEIISVLKGALEPTPGISDRSAEMLGETGRAFLAHGGIFLPYHEKVLFQFLWSYWARRESKLFFPVRIADYEPILERILRKYPSLPMDIDALSDIVGKYVEGHNREGILKILMENGMSPDQASLFLVEIDMNTKFDSELIRQFPNNNLGGDVVESPGMHLVGGRKSEEAQRIFQQIKGTEATAEIRRQWGLEIQQLAIDHPGRRRTIQSLGLGDSLNQLLELLSMEKPTIRMRDKDTPVHFQLLPGSWKQGSPGSPRADWYSRVTTTLNIESVEILLHRDDLAAVVHEGLEVVLTFLPGDKRPDGKPHTYAFLAEMLVNDNGDDLVPQRALEEVDHKSLDELDYFLKASANSRDEIESFFREPSLFVAKNRLLEIQGKLKMRAKEMVKERKMDPLQLFQCQVVQAERSISVGDRVQAQKDLKDLDRFLYHLERTKGSHPLLSGLTADIHGRFIEIIAISRNMSDLERVKAQDFAELIGKLKTRFVFRDFKGLLQSFSRLGKWKSGPLYPEQRELADLWKDIEAVFRPLSTDNNWNASDIKVQDMESRWRDKLSCLGLGHMYVEGLLNGFLEAYRAQRKRGNDWSHYVTHEDSGSKHRIAFLLGFMEMFPQASTSVEELSKISLIIGEIIKLQPATNRELGSPSGARNQRGVVLAHVAVILPGIVGSVLVIGWSVVKGFTDPSFVLHSLFAATVIGLVMVGIIGVVLINVFTRLNDSLDQKKAVAQEFADVLKKALGEVRSPQHPLDLDVGGKDMVRAVASQNGFWMGRYLNEAMAQFGVNPLSFAAARAVVALHVWGAQVLDVSSTGMPEGGGFRPLNVVYLDKGMAAEGVSTLVERYSRKGGASLIYVPTDEEARKAVLDLPATFGGRIFNGGAGRGTRVPGLAEVERRLERAGVDLDHYTGCRVVTPIGMVLDVEGVRSALFRGALVLLLNGLTGVLIKREDLRSIDRAARAVVSAA